MQSYLLLFKLIFYNNLYSVTPHRELNHCKDTEKVKNKIIMY